MHGRHRRKAYLIASSAFLYPLLRHTYEPFAVGQHCAAGNMLLTVNVQGKGCSDPDPAPPPAVSVPSSVPGTYGNHLRSCASLGSPGSARRCGHTPTFLWHF